MTRLELVVLVAMTRLPSPAVMAVPQDTDLAAAIDIGKRLVASAEKVIWE